MGWRGWTVRAYTHKKKLILRKRHFFVREKYIEDVKQDDKDVRDLLESMMKAPGLVKEELHLILMNMRQFRPESTKIRVSTFWRSGKSTDSRGRPMPACSLVSFKLPRPFLPNNWPR